MSQSFPPIAKKLNQTLTNTLIADHFDISEVEGDAPSLDINPQIIGSMKTSQVFNYDKVNSQAHFGSVDLATNGDTAFTVCHFVRFASLSSSMGLVSCLDLDATTNNSPWATGYANSSGNIVAYFNNQDLSADTLVLGSASTGTNYMLMASHDPDANQISGSINAGTRVTDTLTTGLSSNSSPLCISSYFSSDPTLRVPEMFDGQIWGVGIWNRALTDDEITWYYNSGNGRSLDEIKAHGTIYNGLIHFIIPDEDSGNPVDLVGGYSLSNTGSAPTITTISIDKAADVGQRIKTAEDQTSNGFDASQSTETFQPLLRKEGDYFYIDFDGSNDRIDLSGSGLDLLKNQPGISVFAVIDPDLSAQGRFLNFDTSAGWDGFVIGNSSSGNIFAKGRQAFQDASNDYYSDTVLETGRSVISCTFSTSENIFEYFQNGRRKMYTPFLHSVTAAAYENVTSPQLRIGADGGSSPTQLFNGKLFRLIIFPRKVSEKDRLYIERGLMSEFKVQRALRPTISILCEGDSLTSKGGSSALPEADLLHNKIKELLGRDDVEVINKATGGDRIDPDMLADVTDNANADFDQGGTRIQIFWGGTNDIAGSSGHNNPSAAYTDARTFVQNSSGNYNYTIVVTPIPRLNETTTGYMISLRNDIVDNFDTELSVDGATAVVDVQTLSMFDSHLDLTNTTYFDGDMIHLTAEGVEQVAILIVAAINSILNS